MENAKFLSETLKTKNPCGKGKMFPKFNSEMGNDALWRAENQAAIENMATFSFSNAVGEKLIQSSDGSTPGIMVIKTRPSYGRQLGIASSAQKAADAGYNWITQSFTSINNIQPSDLFCYTHAIDDGIAVLITEGKRAYALTKLFSNYNDYLGRKLVNALGFDYDDLKQNLANFRAELNIVINEVNDSFRIPIDSKTLTIKQNMYSRVFVDGIGPKSQIYVFSPISYPRFNEELSTGSALEDYDVGKEYAGFTVSRYFNVLENLIAPLRGNKDITDMAGTILRTYKEEGTIKLTELTEDFNVTLDFDPVLLSEIHNLNVLPYAEPNTTGYWGYLHNAPDPLTNGIINNGLNYLMFQDTKGTLVSNPCIRAMGPASEISNYRVVMEEVSSLIDIADEKPSADLVLDSFAYGYAWEDILNSGTYYLNCSTDLVVGYDIISNSITPGEDVVITSGKTFYSTAESDQVLELLSKLATFDYHPKVVLIDEDAGKCKIYMDIYNFTSIGTQSLTKMYRRSWFGMLRYPKNRATTTKS